MTEKVMTLVERLNNPTWVHGDGAAPNLDTYQTTKDMAEAAICIQQLQRVVGIFLAQLEVIAKAATEAVRIVA